jgi:hypothetical protein
MVQLGVLEEAQEGVGGLDEPDGSLPGLEGSMEADQGPEAGAINEPQGAGVDFDALMFLAEGGMDGELDRRGRGCGEFGESRDPEDGTKGFCFHEGLPLEVEEEGTVEPPRRAVTEAAEWESFRAAAIVEGMGFMVQAPIGATSRPPCFPWPATPVRASLNCCV